MLIKKLCVFCGASAGTNPEYLTQAQELGRLLASNGIGLVYGGGKVGLMGAIADACLDAGGHVTGVIPEALCMKEVEHRGLNEQHKTRSMHERKEIMAKISDGFITLPGGIGTMDEFFEMWTWAQLGIHSKPCAILNVAGYYDPMLDFIERRLVAENFVQAKSRAMLIVSDKADEIIKRMQSFTAPDIRRFVVPQES